MLMDCRVRMAIEPLIRRAAVAMPAVAKSNHSLVKTTMVAEPTAEEAGQLKVLELVGRDRRPSSRVRGAGSRPPKSPRGLPGRATRPCGRVSARTTLARGCGAECSSLRASH